MGGCHIFSSAHHSFLRFSKFGSLVSQHNTEPIARKRDAKTTKIQREDSAEWTVKKILLIHCFAAQVLSR